MARDNENTHLKELGKSSYRVAAGESDIRGWVVKNVEGRVVGVVDDLVIDSEAEKVKYVVVDMTNNELQLRDRKVLLPIDLARLDVPFRHVIYPSTMANELASIPSHERGRFYHQTEGLIATAFAPYYKTDRGNQYEERGSQAISDEGEKTRVVPVPPPPPAFEDQRRDRSTEDERRDGSHTSENTNFRQAASSSPEVERTKPVPVPPPPPAFREEHQSLQDQPLGYAGQGTQGTTGGMGGETRDIHGNPQATGGQNRSDANEDRTARAASQASGGMESREKPQTVVGVFDHTNQAQTAVEYLVKQGIKRENIDIVLRDADDYDTSRKGEEHHSSMSEFFSNLFGGDNRAKDYSDAASTCSVVTVQTDSLRTAEKVAEILDMHGAVNMEDRYKREGRAANTAVVHTKRYQSLIIEYPEEGRVRGLR